MFCALKGATRSPRRTSARHRPGDDDRLAGVGRRAGHEDPRRCSSPGHPARPARRQAVPVLAWGMQLRRFDEANAVQRALRRLVASRPGRGSPSVLLHRLDLARPPDRAAPRPRRASGSPPCRSDLLTTTGARSGEPRTVPLVSLPSTTGGVSSPRTTGRRGHLRGSSTSAPTRDAVLEVDGVTQPVPAEQVHGADRERVREAALAYYAGYTAYEQRAGGRDLGFFILRPTPTPTQRPPRARLSRMPPSGLSGIRLVSCGDVLSCSDSGAPTPGRRRRAAGRGGAGSP